MADRVSQTQTAHTTRMSMLIHQGRGAPRGARGGAAAGRGRGGPQGPQPTMDKPKREAILDLSKYANNRIRVKFTGGREGALFSLSTQCVVVDDELLSSVTGILKGYDQLLNLVLDEVEEQLQGGCIAFTCPRFTNDATEPEPHTRALGLVVLRGPTITLLSPVDGFEEIANPFMQAE